MRRNWQLRLACRLCLQLGIDDPEEWMMAASRRKFNLWSAYWKLEPWGLPWHRSAAWLVKLDQLLEIAISWASGGRGGYKAAQFKDYMPGDWAGDTKTRAKGALAQQIQAVAQFYQGRK